SAGQREHASITFIATAIEGNKGAFARFQVTTESDADGAFAVQLVPGKYRVIAVPDTGTGLGARHEEWSIGADNAYQAGRVIQLDETAILSGLVSGSTPAASPISDAAVVAAATPSKLAADPVAIFSGDAPFPPHASNGSTRADGSFELETDPGEFDV